MSDSFKRILSYFRLWLVRLLLRCKAYRYVYYVGSTEVLPPPLTTDEEIYLIQKLESGDMSVKSNLIEHNLRLVVYIAKKFENTGINIEDLVSIGTIGLIKAVNTFDPHKNIKLATYASRCIENEILMYLRRNQKTKIEVSLDEPLNIDWDGNELLLSDVLGTEVDMIYKQVEEDVEKTLLVQAMLKLSPREKTIIKLRFGLEDGTEKTQKEVADVLGISQSYISRLEKRILKRLKREIKKIE
ncbi:MAG: RNA polymerase sporulation sigma factor SigE [Syntrophomonadaceae bacterium]|jgi:RNA polymerase sporulation-specific sigma factor|nr:RNA polymerase sporulation sigma factor SigE [Syntrophomonadaceae bacterium]